VAALPFMEDSLDQSGVAARGARSRRGRV